jgi:hypothetical protein
MNLFSQQDTNKSNSNLPLMVIAFILFAIGTAFGQTATENTFESSIEMTTTTIENSAAKQKDVSANSKRNFVLWCISSKHHYKS